MSRSSLVFDQEEFVWVAIAVQRMKLTLDEKIKKKPSVAKDTSNTMINNLFAQIKQTTEIREGDQIKLNFTRSQKKLISSYAKSQATRLDETIIPEYAKRLLTSKDQDQKLDYERRIDNCKKMSETSLRVFNKIESTL